MDERELLRTVPLFSELNDDAITSLGRLAARRKYPKDTVVFFENEEGDTEAGHDDDERGQRSSPVPDEQREGDQAQK